MNLEDSCSMMAHATCRLPPCFVACRQASRTPFLRSGRSANSVSRLIDQLNMNQALLVHALLVPPAGKPANPLRLRQASSLPPCIQSKPCLPSFGSIRSGSGIFSVSTTECNTDSMHSISTQSPVKSCLKVASQDESVLRTYPASPSPDKKTVSFGHVKVDWHLRVLGDNPAVR